MEQVDILTPPTFEKSGIIKPIEEAWKNQDWIGTFNLWIVQDKPIPSIIYQVRSPHTTWSPGKFDVTAGGHYQAGEKLTDGLREVKEELGKTYKPEDIVYLGRKINVSPDVKGNLRQNVVDVSIILDDSPIEKYILQKDEVYAIASLPIDELVKVHTVLNYSFKTNIITADKKTIEVTINKNSFPFNWDNYHYKIALLAKRYLNGENNLVY